MPSASHCQTSTAAFEIGARTTRRPRGGWQEEIQMKGCDVVIFKNGKVAVPGCALYMYQHETKRRFPPSQRSGGVALSGGGSHMQTMDMRIDDGRTWLGQLHHFVTRAACTLWRPACRGAGRGGQWTALAVGMAVALAASPGQAVPAVPAGGFGMPTPMSPVNEAIVAGDLDAAGRLSDLGDRYLGQDALADAEAAFRGALAIFEAALGPADPRVADSMTALAVNEMAYGPDDARLASPLANLAGLYLSWERWDQAIPLYLRLANLFERLLGADDFHVAMTLDHVAEAYAGQAHYAEAEEFYGRVL